MKLSLTYRKHLNIKIFIWTVYCLFVLSKLFVINHEYLFVSCIICFFIIRFSIIVFINNWYKNNHPNLLDWFRLATFISLIVQFFTLFDELNNSFYITVFDTVSLSNENVLKALYVVLAGLISLLIGEKIIMANKREIKISKSNFTIKKYNLFLILSLFFLLVELLLSLSNMVGFGSESSGVGLSFVIMFIRIVNSTSLVILSYVIFNDKVSNPEKIKLLFGVIFTVKLILAFISGMKEEILVNLLYVIIPVIVNGKKINKAILIVLSLLMLIIYPLITNYRSTLSKYPNKFYAFTEAVNMTFNKFLNKNDENSSEEDELSLVSRYQGLKPLMYAVENENKWVEFKSMNRYPFVLISWILPRFILPDKPKANTGAKLYQIVRKDSLKTSVSITPTTYGWSYFEGGIIFVIITFFLYSFIVSVVIDFIKKETIFYSIVYILLLTSMIKIESDIYFRIVGLFQLLMVVYFIKKFFIAEENFKDESKLYI